MTQLNDLHIAVLEAEEAVDYARAIAGRTNVGLYLLDASGSLKTALKKIVEEKKRSDKAALQKWNEESDG